MLKTETKNTVKSKSKLSVSDLDFKKQSGLLPVIAQDESSGAVLMLAYANLEAVKKTQTSGLRCRHTALQSKAKWCCMSYRCT